MRVKDLHDKAMEFADLAMETRRKAEWLALEACEYESLAANQVEKRPESEPTRSVLYRSAATLAFDGKAYKTANHLISEGLAGFPPTEIKAELLELRMRVRKALEAQS